IDSPPGFWCDVVRDQARSSFQKNNPCPKHNNRPSGAFLVTSSRRRMIMRIAVIGSGGVGGYFGARLADGGADVRFLARGAHLDAMKSNGIVIEGGPNPIHVTSVNATNDPTEMGIADLVLF